jgi:hypothetical protein
MHYLDFLRELHEVLQPRTYLEIGIRRGKSLALSRARSVAVDPAYEVTEDLPDEVELVRAESDAFFADPNALKSFDGAPVDLSFIDGMHLFEYALRDFMNVERHAAPATVVVFDDTLPRNAEEAARDRTTREWTGDVWKLMPLLEKERRDLVLIPVDTQPTGLLLVVGLDPSNEALHRGYEAAIAHWVDAQPELPEAIVSRQGAVDPAVVLRAPFWPTLRATRDARESKDRLVHEVRAWLRRAGGGVPTI